MAHAITEQNAQADLSDVPEGSPTEAVIEAVVTALWTQITASRGPQLLSYELTTSSLRHPELREVAIEQYRGQWSAAEAVLEEIARISRVRWVVPVPRLARATVAVVDGLSLAWLVDGDDEIARQTIAGFGKFLATQAEPLEPAGVEE